MTKLQELEEDINLLFFKYELADILEILGFFVRARYIKTLDKQSNV